MLEYFHRRDRGNLVSIFDNKAAIPSIRTAEELARMQEFAIHQAKEIHKDSMRSMIYSEEIRDRGNIKAYIKTDLFRNLSMKYKIFLKRKVRRINSLLNSI